MAFVPQIKTYWSDRSMKELKVRFPVVCPKCGAEHLSEISRSLVTDALIRSVVIQLRAPCHDVSWKASPTEIEQLRHYMGAPWIEASPL
jgi:hypothetical protein